MTKEKCFYLIHVHICFTKEKNQLKSPMEKYSKNGALTSRIPQK